MPARAPVLSETILGPDLMEKSHQPVTVHHRTKLMSTSDLALLSPNLLHHWNTWILQVISCDQEGTVQVTQHMALVSTELSIPEWHDTKTL